MNIINIFVLFTVYALVLVDDAHAYLDLGTGSMIIQSLIAGIVGAFFIIKTYWFKLKAKFFKKSENNLKEP